MEQDSGAVGLVVDLERERGRGGSGEVRLTLITREEEGEKLRGSTTLVLEVMKVNSCW